MVYKHLADSLHRKKEELFMENTTQAKSPAKRISVNTLVKIAILSAVSVVVMFFSFPLPFAPSFYKLDLSEIPVLIGGFAMGPMAALIIEGLKNILNILIGGTTTAGVGEFANFCMGCSLAIPASLFYKRNKSKKTALIGLAVGTVLLTIVGSALNYFVLLPAYSYFMKMDLSAFVSMGTKVNASITDLNTLVMFAVVPFNLLKGVVVSLITVLIYKYISPLLKK